LIEGLRGIGERLITRTFLPAAVLREEGAAILDKKSKGSLNLSRKAGPQAIAENVRLA
jgi:hypothetical protein